MRWHISGYVMLPKVRDREKEAERNVGKERKPDEYSCGDTEVEGELIYAIVRKYYKPLKRVSRGKVKRREARV